MDTLGCLVAFMVFIAFVGSIVESITRSKEIEKWRKKD